MERTFIKDLSKHIDSEVLIKGWVDNRRDHGKLIFLDIRDGGAKVQAVVLPGEAQANAHDLRSEWTVVITALVKARPEKMVNEKELNGSLEIEVKTLEVLAKAQELPFDQKAELNLDTRLDYRPLTLRSSRDRAIFKVQHEILRAYREFLTGENFIEFQAPKLVGEDAEGGGNVFKVEYLYDQTAYLATSPQLYKQMMVGVFERVFATGDVFRAEKHSTTRHTNEYTSLDVEFGFIKDHTDIMRLEARLMHFMVKHLGETCALQFKELGAELPLLKEEFPVMKMRDAQKLILEKTGEDHTNEPDLDPSDERFLCEYARAELGSDFIFITHYPTPKRPFYTFDDPEVPGFTRSFDLLFRGVEITTGGQRIHDPEVLIAKAKARGLDPEKFGFYLQAFKYGMPPHGGWGMGLERLTQKFLGLGNLKEATLFPRDINRIDTRLSKGE